jgi:hypothetical protein
MKIITDDLIEKFIEAGLINLKSIDQMRSLEMIREEFKKMEKERIENAFNSGYNNGGLDTCLTPKQYYNETYGGCEQ